MTNGGMMGLLFLLPLFLQQLRGLSATDSGLVTFAQALGVIAMAPVASRAYPKLGPRRMLFIGMLIMTIGTGIFYWIDLDTNLWIVRAVLLFRGLGFGFSIVPLQAATFARVPPQDSGRASALFNTNRQVAGSVGVAILATVLADRIASHVANGTRNVTDQAVAQAATVQGNLDGFHDAFLAATILAVIGMFFTLLIHDEDAAASMGRAEAQAGEAEERQPVAVH
jgi:MFS family permease